MRIVQHAFGGGIAALLFGVTIGNAIAQFGGGKPDVAAAEHAPDAAASTTAAVSTAFCRCICNDNAEAVENIERALAGPLDSQGFQFSEQPLAEVASFLQDNYKVPIQLDQSALEDAGISADEPITVNVRNISLKSGLRLLLKPKGLTYVIRDEVLVITTPEVADMELMTCVYDVRDLINGAQDVKGLQSLMEAICACVAADTWSAKGGSRAEIRPLRPGLLVVSQTRSIQDQIKNLLSAIRATLRQPTVASTGTAHGMTMEGREMGRGYGGVEGGDGRGRGGYGEYGERGGYGREIGAETEESGEPASAGGGREP